MGAGLNPLKWNSTDWKDISLNLGTAGMLGYGEDGITSGVTTQALGQGLAEVTGTAAMTRQMEREMNMADARVIEEERRRELMREQELFDQEQMDRRASARAGASRGRMGSGSSSINQGNFLGL